MKIMRKIDDIKFSVDIKKSFTLKDEVLNYISSTFNVAQFASYSPFDLSPRYSRIFGFNPNYHCHTIKETIQILIDSSQDKSINIRTFKPNVMKGNPFYYGITDVNEAYDILIKSAQDGYFTIVNETIDINDGGVSGVTMNQIIEFSPNDTPKCVDKPGVCSLPIDLGINILKTVYGFDPNLDLPNNYRVEFSIHPKRRGFKKEHTIIWEVEDTEVLQNQVDINWPNNFSRFIGDKAFGLLIANNIGTSVPKSTLLSRNVAPFTFGENTGLSEIWFRTCPIEKTAGKYPTYFGWSDPFKAFEDKEISCNVTSILSQNSVDAKYSGAAMPSDTELLIEGIKGFGDDFMIGKKGPIQLPSFLLDEINNLYNDIYPIVGNVNFEWVFDGQKVWIVQLSKNTISSTVKTIYPGDASNYVEFNVEQGLESLRDLISNIKSDTGIKLIGNIGITSHFGDLLRNAKIPSILN